MHKIERSNKEWKARNTDMINRIFLFMYIRAKYIRTLNMYQNTYNIYNEILRDKCATQAWNVQYTMYVLSKRICKTYVLCKMCRINILRGQNKQISNQHTLCHSFSMEICICMNVSNLDWNVHYILHLTTYTILKIWNTEFL